MFSVLRAIATAWLDREHDGHDCECVAAEEQAHRERRDAPISVDAQEEYVLCERSHSSVYTADRFMPGIHIEVVVVV